MNFCSSDCGLFPPDSRAATLADGHSWPKPTFDGLDSCLLEYLHLLVWVFYLFTFI